jgi:hypothetical protein
VLRLSDEQMAALGADAQQRYEATLAAEMGAEHPEMGDSEASARVVERVRAAVAAGETDEAAVTGHVRTTFALDPMPAPRPPPAQRSRTEQRTDPAPQPSRTVGSAMQSCLTFIGIELVDEDGDPVPDEPYVIELPDGSKRKGRTDGAGKAQLAGVPAGTYHVTFPQAEVTKK